MIKYQLIESSIATEPGACHAIVSSSDSRNLDQIIQHMISEGTGLTKPQAMAYFEKLSQSILYFLEFGFSISTPLFKIRPTMNGKFDSKEDNYDPNRHQFNYRFSPGLRFRDMTSGFKIEKVEASSQAPAPTSFTDANTDGRNETATPGSLGMLKGKRLRFDKEDLKQGVFFESLDNPENVVRVAQYSDMNPSKLHFLVPALGAGEYKIVVRRMSDNGKQHLAGELSTTVTV
jgi:hypothetical protein